MVGGLLHRSKKYRQYFSVEKFAYVLGSVNLRKLFLWGEQLCQPQRGFTLIELLLLGGIVAILASISTINFFSTQGRLGVEQAASRVIADLSEQQTRAMVGQAAGGSPGNTEIVWGTNEYTLNPGGRVIELPTGVVVASNGFAGGKVEFAKNSGEVVGFVLGQDSVTLRHEGTGREEIVKVNVWGVVVE